MTRLIDLGLSDHNEALRDILFNVMILAGETIWPDGCDDDIHPFVTAAHVRMAADVLMNIAAAWGESK
jgi:hypothetical protein